MSDKLYKQLKKKIAYAKTCLQPLQALYEVKGEVGMAYDLGGITLEQLRELDTECVRNGINNMEYIKKEAAFYKED